MRNFDSAPLHLSRGLSPYGKTEKELRKNASTLPKFFFYFTARLIAIAHITKALIFQYITGSRYL